MNIIELAQLRAELSNPAIGSKDHLRKLSLSLVEALEKAQQQTTESENRVRKQNRHICDLFDDNTALCQRIAELESRTVKLPQRYDLIGDTDGNCSLNDAEMAPDNDGVYLRVRDVREMLTAAGIKVEAE